jgi:hypothetical protein
VEKSITNLVPTFPILRAVTRAIAVRGARNCVRREGGNPGKSGDPLTEPDRSTIPGDVLKMQHKVKKYTPRISSSIPIVLVLDEASRKKRRQTCVCSMTYRRIPRTERGETRRVTIWHEYCNKFQFPAADEWREYLGEERVILLLPRGGTEKGKRMHYQGRHLHSGRWIHQSAVLCIVLGLTVLMAEALAPEIARGPLGWMDKISLDEAVGLVFAGFAVRFAGRRIQAGWSLKRGVAFSYVASASQIGLIVLAVFGLAGQPIVAEAVGQPSPVRMSAAAAMSFLFLGAAVGSPRFRLPSRMRALSGMLAGACLCAGWLEQGLAANYPGLAIPPAVALALSALTVAVLRDSGEKYVQVLSAGNPAGQAARLAMPVALSLPVLLAVIRLKAEAAGVLHPDLGVVLHVLCSMSLMGGVIAWQTGRIASVHAVKEGVVQKLQDKEEQFWTMMRQCSDPVLVFDEGGTVLYSNRAGQFYLGTSGEQKPEVSGPELFSAETWREIVRASLFPGDLSTVTMRQHPTGDLYTLGVRMIRTCMYKSHPGHCLVFMASATPYRVVQAAMPESQLPAQAGIAELSAPVRPPATV